MTAVAGKGSGVFGGTFDPVHIGHLRTALELRGCLHMECMRLIPCAVPPHRPQPWASASQRMAMLLAAVAGEPGLVPDNRELQRPGPSYTFDTLAEIRAEIGPQSPLYLCVGMDSLVSLDTWHRWRELMDLAHIVVAARPHWRLPTAPGLRDWIARHLASSPQTLQSSPAGKLWLAEMTLLPVSSTEIREALSRGQSPRYLVPDPVLDYIAAHHLYAQKMADAQADIAGTFSDRPGANPARRNCEETNDQQRTIESTGDDK